MDVAEQAQRIRLARESSIALAEQRRAATEQRKQENADRAAMGSALQAGGGVEEATIAAARQNSPTIVPTLTEYFQKSRKGAAEVSKLEEELNTARLNHIGLTAEEVLKHGATPEAVQTALAWHADLFPKEADQIAQLGQRLQGMSPEQLKGYLEQTRNSAPAYQARAAKNTPQVVAPGGTLVDDTGKALFTAPVKPPTVNAGSFEDYVTRLAKEKGIAPEALSTTDIEAARKKYQQADDRPRVNVSVGATAGGDALSTDAVEYTATQYRLLGSQGIPTRLSDVDKRAIINAAAKQTKALGQSPAQAVQRQAAFKSDAGSLTKMTSMKSAAEAFETKAMAQADLVQSLSDKVNRTNIPAINAAILSGKINIAGDETAQLYANALTTFGEEYAKIMGGSTGSAAAATDSARRTAHDLIRVGLTKGQISSTIKQMQWEMRQTLLGYDATIDHITTRMGGAPQAATAPAADLVYDPKTGQFKKPGGG